MINFLIGQSCTGKTSYILDKIKENEKNETLSYLIVPEQLTFEYEQLIANEFAKPVFFTKIMSFERLSENVISKVGGLKREYIDDIGKSMYLKKLFMNNDTSYSIYNSSKGKDGFIEQIISILKSLKAEDITPEKLYEIYEDLDDDLLLKSKLLDVYKIYSLIEDSLKDKYYDNEGRLNILNEKLDKIDSLSEIDFYFDSFHNFSQLEYNIIEKLIKLNVNITFSITLDPNYADYYNRYFSITKKSFDKILNYTKENNQEYNFIKFNEIHNPNEDIKNLTCSIGNLNKQNYKLKDESVFINKFTTPKIEIQYLASKIHELIKIKGYRYRDIAVVSPNAQDYEIYINKYFDQYHIPFFIDSKKSIMQENIINLLFSFLNLFSENMDMQNVISLLKTGYTDVDNNSIYLFENFLLQWNINNFSIVNKKKFENETLFKNYTKPEINSIKNCQKFILKLYKKYNSIFKDENSVENYNNAIINFLEENNAKEKLNKKVSELKEDENYLIASKLSLIWNDIIDVITQLNLIMGECNIKLEEYKQILLNGLESKKIAVIPPCYDQVLILNNNRSKILRKKIIFYIGLCDTKVPSISNEDSIILEEEKNYLYKNFNINIPGTVSNLIENENINFYFLSTRADDKIYYSFSLTDTDNISARPSLYLLDIYHSFENIHMNLMDSNIQYSTNEALFEYMCEKLRDEVELKELTKQTLDIYSYFKSLDEYKDKLKSVNNSVFFENKITKIDIDYTKKLYKKTRHDEENYNLSVSQLETYRKCPFKHFMDYGIKPKPRELGEINLLQIGSIFHKSMEEFTLNIKNKKSEEIIEYLNSKEKIEYEIDKIYDSDNFFPENISFLGKNSKRINYTLSKLKKSSYTAANLLIEQLIDSSFSISEIESEIPPLEIDTFIEDNDKKIPVKIVGKIDRIDKFCIDCDEENKNCKDCEKVKFIKIIDYKSSKKEISLLDVYNGLNLQMMVYMYSIVYNEKNARPAACFYFPIVDKKINTTNVDEDKIQEMITENLKMNGIILNDEQVIHAMEKSFVDSSRFFKLSIKKDGLTGKNLLNKEDFDNLLNHVYEKCKEYCNEIFSGDIRPLPIKETCANCDYKQICKFQENCTGYNYQKPEDLDDKTILERIQGGASDEMDK